MGLGRLASWVLWGGLSLVSSQSHAAAQSEAVVAAERDQMFLLDVDDALERANGRLNPGHEHISPPHVREWEGMTTIAIVFHRFFSGVVPNDTGIERPSTDDHMVDEFEVPIAPRLSYVLMGAANVHVLTQLHFYQQFDGLNTLRYDLLDQEGNSPFRLAIDFAPTYGSLTQVTRHSGVASSESLPLSVIVGAAGGVDAWYELPLVQFHARVLAMPGVDVVNGDVGGVEIVETLQMKWRLTEVFHLDPTWPIDLGLIAMHLERGDARAAIYSWAGDYRSPAVLRELWQLMAILELRVN